MAYNLARNSRVFVTTNLNATGVNAGRVKATGFTTTNTWEIQVLDGFTFSQGTESTSISINEAGNTPIRGQRAFNTALNPVELSFSTYIRPKNNTSTVGAEEKTLWNALMGSVGIEATTDGVPNTVTSVTLGGTPTTLVRASTSSPTFTITGGVITALTVGGIYCFSGITGSAAPDYNKPFKVTSSSTSTLIGDFLTAPPNAGVANPVGNVTLSAAVKCSQSAWIDHPTAAGVTIPYGQLTSAFSNKNQLLKLGFIFNVDSTWYTIDDAAMDSATIDFGLDAIAMIAWTAKGTRLNNVDMTANTGANMAAANPVFGTGGTGLTGTATGRTTDAAYITNKLSTVTLKSTLGGVGGTPAATSYQVVLTGGSIAISNNITYVTPSNIGTVNIPIGYFTGARSISGTMNAYLRTGTAGDTGSLLNAMLADIASAAETKFKLQLEIGGLNNTTRVEVEMPGVVLGVPSVDIQDVVSTAITFNAQGTAKDLNGVTTAASYDIENTNDLQVRYYVA